MDGKGRALDNIFIERLWRTVKYENVYLHAYTDGLDLYRGLKKYFEFYNYQRVHQGIDYKIPSQLFGLAAWVINIFTRYEQRKKEAKKERCWSEKLFELFPVSASINNNNIL